MTAYSSGRRSIISMTVCLIVDCMTGPDIKAISILASVGQLRKSCERAICRDLHECAFHASHYDCSFALLSSPVCSTFRATRKEKEVWMAHCVITAGACRNSVLLTLHAISTRLPHHFLSICA